MTKSSRRWTVYGVRLSKPGARLHGRIVYVGYTRTPLWRRLTLHKFARIAAKVPLASAIKKHGPEAFSIEPIVNDIETIEQAKAIEIREISARQTNARGNGYNATAGGDGPHHDGDRYRVPFLRAMKKRSESGSAWRDAVTRGQRSRWSRSSERKAQSRRAVAQFKNPEARRRHAEAIKARSADPLFREKQRQRTLALLADPNHAIRDQIGRTKRWESYWVARGDATKAQQHREKRRLLQQRLETERKTTMTQIDTTPPNATPNMRGEWTCESRFPLADGTVLKVGTAKASSGFIETRASCWIIENGMEVTRLLTDYSVTIQAVKLRATKAAVERQHASALIQIGAIIAQAEAHNTALRAKAAA